MSNLIKINNTTNVDVQTILKSGGKEGYIVEARITKFSFKEDKAHTEKVIDVSHFADNFSEAQDGALNKAVELMGL